MRTFLLVVCNFHLIKVSETTKPKTNQNNLCLDNEYKKKKISFSLVTKAPITPEHKSQDLSQRRRPKRPVHTRDPINPRSLPLWKNGRIANERALIGESVCWSKIQRGLVGPALRGRGERDKFSTGWKMVRGDPALHRSYVERGYSVVTGGTA